MSIMINENRISVVFFLDRGGIFVTSIWKQRRLSRSRQETMYEQNNNQNKYHDEPDTVCGAESP